MSEKAEGENRLKECKKPFNESNALRILKLSPNLKSTGEQVKMSPDERKVCFEVNREGKEGLAWTLGGHALAKTDCANLEQPGSELLVEQDVESEQLEADAVGPWWLTRAAHPVRMQHVRLRNNQRLDDDLAANTPHR